MDYEDNQKLLHFLMDLNDEYLATRGNILMMKPLPTLSTAYGILLQEEKQRSLQSSSHILAESSSMHVHSQTDKSRVVVSARASPFRFFGSSFPNTVNLSRLNTAKQRLVIRNACDFDQNQGSPSLPCKDFMKEVGISCSKNGAYFSDEISQFRRRDLTFSAGMFVIGSSGLFAENANAADLIQRRQRSEFQSSVKGTLYNAIKAKPDLISPILSLALNDAITYDKATKTGGPNGSIRFSSEIDRPENIGLSSALSLLEELKKEIDAYSKGGPISIADLIQFAAQAAIKSTFLDAAVRKCGGNEEKGRLLYTAYGSNGQWGQFDKIFGRADAQEPDPEGRVPQWDKASVKEMKDKFSSVGLGPRQLAVLSAFLGPDQVATENLLATDSDVAPWVQKYQRSRETVSQTDYEVDLITTLTKLSSLGQSINYEAYTYPVKKVDLSKLRL